MYLEFKSKEELYKYLETNDLHGLDSEYSFRTNELKDKFKAKGVHFNKWWVMTPTNWKCPVCKRDKSQIVRLNKHGDLSGQLHEHHDHMKDLVKKRFQELSASKKTVVADSLAEKFATRLSFSFAAYDNTVICSDCNSADMEAKKLINSHKYFSFAPSDISEFIIVNDNLEHQIDEKKAKQIWEGQKEVFKIRMEFLDKLADIAAENTHWYKPSKITAKQTENTAGIYFEKYGLRKLNRGWPENLLYETNKYAGNKSTWRSKSKNISVMPPSNGEIEHMVKLNGKHWNKYDDDWHCPICLRSKVDCIQKSNKGSWFFTTVNKLFLEKNNIHWCENIEICSECSKVVNLIKKEVDILEELTMSDHWFLKVDELKQIVIQSQNTSHAIDNNYFEKLLPTLKIRMEEDEWTYSEFAPCEDEEDIFIPGIESLFNIKKVEND